MQAWDRLPRAGGKQVGIIRLTRAPYQEYLNDAPASDYIAEGLRWMEQQGRLVNGREPTNFWYLWRSENPLVWVIRFVLVQP